ncbi:MAG: putative SIGNAL PEPTIDE PROTEIN [Nitrospira sp.]|jgi:uncharacterized protein (DUF1800 family)|nr:MAG: putative SIGNAL PEPTIDE PROTEIN [Nitrospira sp.]
MSLTFDDARHFLSRSGFGGTPGEIRRLMTLDRAVAVEQALTVSTNQTQTPPPPWIHRLPPPPNERKQWSEADKKAFREARKEEGQELKGWWYRELMATNSSLLERMTLFWHNHFTSGLQKVKWPPFLYRQNVLLRTYALGSFRTLLHAVAKDPAMLLYLDTQTNHKEQPNENFARELFELFTLGEGHYHEQDIKEAARAFTGWHLDRHTGAFRIERRRHDSGRKEVFGKSGYFDGDDILSLTLEQPQTSRYLVRKLWREFISDEPDPTEVDRLAGRFRLKDYDITSLLEELFRTSHFWAPEHRGVLVKSPVELMTGTMRLFNLPIDEPTQLIRYGRRLGQDLFDPPNVKGWPGGTRWITTSTLLDRIQLLHRVIRGHELGHSQGMSDMNRMHVGTWQAEEPIDIVQATLLPLAPVQPLNADEDRVQAVRHLVLDPVYQLK